MNNAYRTSMTIFVGKYFDLNIAADLKHFPHCGFSVKVDFNK